LEASNPEATINFIETEVSLIKNVDSATNEIKSKEKKVDVLHVSPGYLSFGGRLDSSEGIDIPHALRYYSRLRFVYNLLPLLHASSNPRVISILAAGMEKPIDVTNLELKRDFNTQTAMFNGTTQTTLALEELAKSNPDITFIHKYPGFVDTSVLHTLLTTAKGIYVLPALFADWFIVPVVNLFAMSVDEAGERGLFLATSARYPPSKPKGEFVGTPLPKGVEVAKSSVEVDGVPNGVYRLGRKDDSAPEAEILPVYRKDGTETIVWEETLKVWERALERSG